MKLRNRIVMPPMVRNLASPDGIITRQLIDHYIARARGGVGLAIVEATFIDPAGKISYQQLGIHDDKCVPSLSDLAGAVKEWGSKIAIQLCHAGRQTTTSITGGLPVVAPSAIPCPVTGGLPRELTTEEVGEVVESFAQAARRAKQAGFDAVEIHAAHGYILNQFLSPNTNRRTDKYGGDINGRMTIVLEIVRRTRELVGNNYPIMVRLNAVDLVDGGLELSESSLVAQKLETVGVDALDISLGTYENRLNPRVTSTQSSLYEPKGHEVGYAEQIKKVVSLPVITVGAITPEMGEEILQQGKADFIAMGRGLLADPEIPNKLAKGEPESIRRCIRCQEMCRRTPLPIRCSINAECGFESYKLTPAFKPKKVLIVGGGAAGMEAARVSALRGHDVTLYEKNRELGGHLIEATVPDFKEDLKNYKDWLIRQIKGLGVNIKLGKPVTRQLVDTTKPDAVIIATGSSVYRPDIPGLDKPIVVTAIDILLGKAEPGNETVVAGGGVVGCETALYLALKGKKVTVVEMLSAVACDVPTISGTLAAKLIDNGVTIRTNLKIIAFTDQGVTGIDRDQNLVTVAGDGVALAMGLIPQAGLYEELRGKVRELYLIGDSAQPRRVGEATRDGYRVGSII